MAACRVIPGPAGRLLDPLGYREQDGQADPFAEGTQQRGTAGSDAAAAASWNQALRSLGIASYGEQHALLQMNIAKAHAMPFQKLPKLLTLVDSLTTTSTGDLFALLKDPSGQIHAAVHRSVLEEEPSFAVGATVMLQQVSVFAMFRSPCCLCVTADNILQVFPAAALQPTRYPARHALRHAAATAEPAMSGMGSPAHTAHTQALNPGRMQSQGPTHLTQQPATATGTAAAAAVGARTAGAARTAMAAAASPGPQCSQGGLNRASPGTVVDATMADGMRGRQAAGPSSGMDHREAAGQRGAAELRGAAEEDQEAQESPPEEQQLRQWQLGDTSGGGNTPHCASAAKGQGHRAPTPSPAHGTAQAPCTVQGTAPSPGAMHGPSHAAKQPLQTSAADAARHRARLSPASPANPSPGQTGMLPPGPRPSQTMKNPSVSGNPNTRSATGGPSPGHAHGMTPSPGHGSVHPSHTQAAGFGPRPDPAPGQRPDGAGGAGESPGHLRIQDGWSGISQLGGSLGFMETPVAVPMWTRQNVPQAALGPGQQGGHGGQAQVPGPGLSEAAGHTAGMRPLPRAGDGAGGGGTAGAAAVVTTAALRETSAAKKHAGAGPGSGGVANGGGGRRPGGPLLSGMGGGQGLGGLGRPGVAGAQWQDAGMQGDDYDDLDMSLEEGGDGGMPSFDLLAGPRPAGTAMQGRQAAVAGPQGVQGGAHPQPSRAGVKRRSDGTQQQQQQPGAQGPTQGMRTGQPPGRSTQTAQAPQPSCAPSLVQGESGASGLGGQLPPRSSSQAPLPTNVRSSGAPAGMLRLNAQGSVVGNRTTVSGANAMRVPAHAPVPVATAAEGAEALDLFAGLSQVQAPDEDALQRRAQELKQQQAAHQHQQQQQQIAHQQQQPQQQQHVQQQRQLHPTRVQHAGAPGGLPPRPAPFKQGAAETANVPAAALGAPSAGSNQSGPGPAPGPRPTTAMLSQGLQGAAAKPAAGAAAARPPSRGMSKLKEMLMAQAEEEMEDW